ncbi:MAG: LysR substrate-binding domain-containing protein [Chromatiales bacterium]|nr:LysR substrate-binding domain-containing protein [Chromatiales bacterium]
MKGLGGGRLRISVATTANYFIPTLLGTFSRRYPDVTISPGRDQPRDPAAATGREHRRPGDHGPAAGRGRRRGARLFMDNPLVVVAPPDHPLATREEAFRSNGLQDEAFLVREPGSGTRIAMERFFSERGMHLKTGMEVGSNEAIKQSVQAGLGLGLLSRATIEPGTRALQAPCGAGRRRVPHRCATGSWCTARASACRQRPRRSSSFVLAEAHHLLRPETTPAHGNTTTGTRTRRRRPTTHGDRGQAGQPGPYPGHRNTGPARVALAHPRTCRIPAPR